MRLYWYDRPGRTPVARWYSVGRAPETYRGAKLRRAVERRDHDAPAGWVSDRHIPGIHHGPGRPTIIRNRFDIAEAEARQPGLKFAPEVYHERRRR